jgi:hypothetical protein
MGAFHTIQLPITRLTRMPFACRDWLCTNVCRYIVNLLFSRTRSIGESYVESKSSFAFKHAPLNRRDIGKQKCSDPVFRQLRHECERRIKIARERSECLRVIARETVFSKSSLKPGTISVAINPLVFAESKACFTIDSVYDFGKAIDMWKPDKERAFDRWSRGH